MELKNLTEPECCKMAIDVQNACNPRGVAHDYHRLIVSLSDICKSDRQLAKHPAHIIYRNKLDTLIGTPVSQQCSLDEYGAAYQKCKETALAAGLKIYE